MIGLDVITADNKHLFATQMEQFFRLRHIAFAEERGWVPTTPDKREMDEFDTKHATYLLGCDGEEVVCSSRLSPMSEPSLVSKHFEELCLDGVPKHDDWVEWTRATVAKDRRGQKHRGLSGLLTLGVMQYCVEEGISYVGGVQEVYMLPRWAELGWNTKILGPSKKVGDEEYVVAYFECNRKALESARRVTNYNHDVLNRFGPIKPFLRSEDTDRETTSC